MDNYPHPEPSETLALRVYKILESGCNPGKMLALMLYPSTGDINFATYDMSDIDRIRQVVLMLSWMNPMSPMRQRVQVGAFTMFIGSDEGKRPEKYDINKYQYKDETIRGPIVIAKKTSIGFEDFTLQELLHHASGLLGNVVYHP